MKQPRQIKSRRGRSSLGILHIHSRLEPKPAYSSLLDYEQLLCAHFAKVAHTPSLRIVTISHLKSFCYWQNTFSIFPDAESSKDVFSET